MSNIKFYPTEYELKISGSKREFQELEYIVDKYIEEESYTSGDNPAWSFMKEIHSTLNRIYSLV